jgi:hypothetical protein
MQLPAKKLYKLKHMHKYIFQIRKSKLMIGTLRYSKVLDQLKTRTRAAHVLVTS